MAWFEIVLETKLRMAFHAEGDTQEEAIKKAKKQADTDCMLPWEESHEYEVCSCEELSEE